MSDRACGHRPRSNVVVAVRDELLRDALAVALDGEALKVDGLAHPDLVRRLLSGDDVDLAIVDSNGDEAGEWTVVRRIRSASDVTVLALASSGDVDDRLEALRAGADSVLSPPFSLAELLVHVAAMLRRASPPKAGRIVLGDLVVDEDEHLVIRGGQEVHLTAIEFSLLSAFCRNPRRVLSKSQLLSIVWGYDEFDPNVVEVHVSALRRKLEALGPRVVHTVRSVGYVLRPDLVEASSPTAC